MMKSWFECKVRYEKMMENGSTKKVTEHYLVDAVNFSDAETKITEEMLPFVSQGEFVISDIKRAKYAEVWLTNEESADRYFKCKIVFIHIDERTGNEKRSSSQILIQASSIEDAKKRLDEQMKATLADYNVSGLNETPLLDVYAEI